MTLMQMKTKSTKRLLYWYHLGASAVIVGAAVGTSCFLFQRVQNGTFVWWLYPAFVLLTVVIFWLDWFLSGKGGGQEEEAEI